MGSDGQHRTNKYLNHRLEQDHRGTKERYYPMRGFGAIEAAAGFCCAFDYLCYYFRPRRTMGERVAFAEQRRAFLQRLFTLKAKLQAASLQKTSSIEVSNESMRYCVLSSDRIF